MRGYCGVAEHQFLFAVWRTALRHRSRWLRRPPAKRKIIGAIVMAHCATSLAHAGAFWGGTVWRVPTGQTLSIRGLPSPAAPIRGTTNNGGNLSLTGTCRRISPSGATAYAFRIDGAGTSASRYAQIKQSRIWCELMHEPTPGYPEIGWARGVFINPN